MSQKVFNATRKRLCRINIGKYNEEDEFEDNLNENEELEV